MRRTAAVATLLVCFSALPTNAYVVKGHLLLKSCTSKTELDQGVCSGYIRGVLAGFTLSKREIAIKSKMSVTDVILMRGICYEKTTTTEEIVEIVKKRLIKYPEKWNKSGSFYVIEALREALPCK